MPTTVLPRAAVNLLRERMAQREQERAVTENFLRQAQRDEEGLPAEIRSYLRTRPDVDFAAERAQMERSDRGPYGTSGYTYAEPGEIRATAPDFSGDKIANQIGQGVQDGIMLAGPGGAPAKALNGGSKAVIGQTARGARRQAQVGDMGFFARRRAKKAADAKTAEREAYAATPEGQAELVGRRIRIQADRERFTQEAAAKSKATLDKNKAKIAELSDELRRMGIKPPAGSWETIADSERHIVRLNELAAIRQSHVPAVKATGSGVPAIPSDRSKILELLDNDPITKAPLGRPSGSKGKVALTVPGVKGAVPEEKVRSLVERYANDGGKLPTPPATRPWGYGKHEVIQQIVRAQVEKDRLDAVTNKIAGALRRSEGTTKRTLRNRINRHED